MSSPTLRPHRRRRLLRHLACLLFAAAVSLLMAGRGAAQTTGTTAPTDTAGRPAGSYQLSGFENINLYSGNLNFRLPLLSVGGRGAAGTAITLAVNNPRWKSQRWTERTESGGGGGEVCTECRNGNYWIDGQIIVQDDGQPITVSGTSQSGSFVEVKPDPLLGLPPGYGPGILKGIPAWNKGAGTYSRGYTLTRLTFTAPDGTEYALVDRDTFGEPKPLAEGGFSRGTVFVSNDGSAATFISDEAIRDLEHVLAGTVDLPARVIYPTGYLLFADGTRYRIVGGLVRWLRDRNGNMAKFDYDAGGRVTLITDPLGRQVTVTYATAETPYDQIGFKGFGGEPRAIRVHRAKLENAFRAGAGYTVMTCAALFADIDNSSTALPHNPDGVATAVELPNGARYELRYNPYGELERVELPTGGAFEYRYGGGLVSTDRRVVQRLVFQDKYDAVPAARHVYHAAYPASPFEPRVTAVTVSEQDGAGAQLAFSRHSFHGVEGSYSFGFYPSWKEGREFRTELYAEDGVTPLRRIERAWLQRAAVPWYTQSQDKAPQNDPRLVETTTTVEPDGTNLTTRTTSIDPLTGAVGFDQFNNQTEVYEYDYGPPGTGQPGPLLRRTHTDYVTAAAYIDASLDPAAGAHLRRLPSRQWVSADAAGASKASLTTYEYDNYGADARHAPLLPRANIVGMCAYFPNGLCAATGPNGETPAQLTSRGNVTGVTAYADAAGQTGAVTTSTQYDIAGNPVRTVDARGHSSSVSYADSFCNGAGCGGTFTLHTYAFPTSNTSPVPDPTGANGSSTALTTFTKYDFQSGLVFSATDANGRVTTYSYVDDQGAPDPLDRLRRVTRPDGGRTRYEYGDAVGSLFISTLADLDASRAAESKQYFDGLGRAVRSFIWENQEEADPWLTTDTEYDALGRVRRASNQYRSPGPGSAINPPALWTTTSYDALGRVTEVMTPDGAKFVTAYAGNAVTETDQAGKQRRSVTDALGRPVRVDEPDKVTGALNTAGGAPVQPTSYAYDPLGNLRKIDQGGQLRFFAFDALGRVVRARTPEQGVMTADADFPALTDSASGTSNSEWSVGYKHDAAGNLTKRKDARGIKVDYEYDALNRNKSVNYSDATPDVTRYYDGAVLGRGRPWKSEAAGASRATVSEYDALGRPKAYQQQFWQGSGWGSNYSVGRQYDLAGHVISQSYPSGRTVSYVYDVAGRLSGFTGYLGDGALRAYSAGVTYDAQGGIKQEQFGTDTPLYNKRFFNKRGQLTQIRVGTQSADAGWWNRGAIINHYTGQQWAGDGTDNNGNLVAQDIFVPHDEQIGSYWAASQRYEYDTLNRLTKVVEAQGGADRWTQMYNYDRWGNRTVNATGTWLGTPTADPDDLINEKEFDKDDLNATNRLYAKNDLTLPEAQRKMRYDQTGNLTQDLCHENGTLCARVYDGENRMTQAQFLNGQVQTVRYVYDAAGRRVVRSGGWEGQVRQVYGFDGELLAEYTPQAPASAPRKEYGYRAGELLVTAESPHSAGRANFALAAAGATATASSTLDSNRSPSGAIDGDRAGHNWGSGGGWHDATNNSYPDWLEVDFGEPKTIDEVDVFSVQDTYWNPQEPSEAAAFAQYGLVDFDVQYLSGSTWVTVPGGAVRANSVVWRRLKFAPVTTQKVRVRVLAAQAGYSRLAELEAWGPAGPPPPRLNVAAASAGATATTSSTLDAGRAASAAINGDRAGRNWGSGGGWHDATQNAFPDWLEVTFAGSRTVDEVHVFSVQDNFLSPSEPTEQQTFSQYGVTAFGVQWWDGSAWQTAETVSGNNRVWRKVSFSPVTTTKIRVQVTGALAGYSRLAEVEAYGEAAAADVRWLVADQLGTPRMVFDRTGSLAGVARHDYLPFGEEVTAGVASRTAAQGYGGDAVRQRFTSKERDGETGLDYFLARYYASAQGRFTSVDSVSVTPERLADPQRLNLYTYARNNPLKFIDPDGKDVISIELVVTGANQLAQNDPKWKSQEAGRVEQLGPKVKGGSFVFAVNIVVTVTADDSADNYEPVQKAFIIRPEGKNTDPHRPGVSGEEMSDNPEKKNVIRIGPQLVWYDNPGLQAPRSSPAAGVNGDFLAVFSSTVKPKDGTNGKNTDIVRYWGVRFTVKDGKIVDPVAVKITAEEYYKLTGGKSPKPPPPQPRSTPPRSQ